jgi:hypothetical protein
MKQRAQGLHLASARGDPVGLSGAQVRSENEAGEIGGEVGKRLRLGRVQARGHDTLTPPIRPTSRFGSAPRSCGSCPRR